VLLSRASSFAPPQAFNPVGDGQVDGTAVTGPAPGTTGEGSTHRERSTEAYLRGQTRWDEHSQLWWGLRHTRLAPSGGVSHAPTALPGLQLSLRASHESDRTVLPGNEDLRIPGWTRVDAGFNYEQALSARTTWVWRGGIDNLANRRAWRESPYQLGHVYLFPMAPRTAWLTLEVRL
jgi:outer membrane receptor protein involved in Fe transport